MSLALRMKFTRFVMVGRLPVPAMESPVTGRIFAVGDVFTLVGSASDGYGNRLLDSDLTWEVRQHHSTHYHPFLDSTPGNQIKISPAPGPEDFEAFYQQLPCGSFDGNRQKRRPKHRNN
jgi:hypothetical protein